MGEFDIRNITFSKWLIPKTHSMVDVNSSAISSGYFDLFEIEKVSPTAKEHPLVSAYKVMHNTQQRYYSDSKESHTKHSVLLFAQCEDSEQKDRIEEFWKDISGESRNNKSDMIYICMLKLAQTQTYKPTMHSRISEWIDIAFQTAMQIKEYKKHYVWYYSFDFSDIVIICKNITIETYSKALSILNYFEDIRDNKDRNKYSRIIKDTITVYGFTRVTLEKKFQEFERLYNNSRLCKELLNDSGNINLQIEIGIQDCKNLNEFKYDLDKILHADEDLNLTLGRFDISLFAKNKSEQWVEYFLYLLNRHTIKSEGINEVFCKYSITLGTSYNALASINSIDYKIAKLSQKLSLYEATQMDEEPSLFWLCKKYKEKIQSSPKLENYYMSADEIYKSILSVLRTGFSDEFVLCIYHSFYQYLDYVVANIDLRDINKHDEFYDLQRHFFSNLSALINCMIHSDREFIQIPSFNASLYTVPPKLLALYTAIANRIEALLNDSKSENSKQIQTYTFMFTPSFKQAIEVVSITGSAAPNNRILTVYANESVLYDPNSVISTMSHEIAHYVGDNSRQRDLRKEKILNSIISYLIRYFECNVIHMNLDTKVRNTLIAGINKAINDTTKNHIEYASFYKKPYMEQLRDFLRQTNYLTDLLNLGDFTAIVLRDWQQRLSKGNKSTNQFLKECVSAMDNFADSRYLRDLLHENKEECIRIVTEYIYSQFCASISEMLLYHTNDYFNYCKDICSLFSETYSDLAMNIILGVCRVEDYFTTFDNLVVFEQMPYVFRIRKAVIAKVVFSDYTEYQSLFDFGSTHDESVDIDKIILYKYVFCQLSDYLNECQKELKRHLNSKKKDLRAVQNLATVFDEFENLESVIYALQSELNAYRKKMCQLNQ